MKAVVLGMFRRRRGKHKVSEAAHESEETEKMMSANGELDGSLAEFGKKSALLSKMSSSATATSNNCYSSTSASEKVLKSSSSTSVTSKKSQVRHAISSSTAATSSQKVNQTQQQQEHQNEMFQENRNFSRSVSVTSNASSSSDSRLKLLSCSSSRDFSVDELPSEGEMTAGQLTAASLQEMKFEQQRVTSSSKMKVSTSEGYTAEKVAACNQERKKINTGNICYDETSSSAAVQKRLETEGYSTEEISAIHQDQVQLKTADSLQQQQRTAMASSMKLSTDEFTAEKSAINKQEEKRTFLQGMVQAEKNVSSSSKMTFTSKGIAALSSQNAHHIDISDVSPSLGMSLSGTSVDTFCIPNSNSIKELEITEGIDQDIEILTGKATTSLDIERAINRFGSRMATCVDMLKTASEKEAHNLLKTMCSLLKKAWAIPTYGHDLGFTMCNILLNNGGLKILVNNCVCDSSELQHRSAEVLEQCLSTENRAYVVDNGLEQVVKAACSCSTKCLPSLSRVGTGILQHLFKHSEATCSNVIRLGGLKTILFNCRSSDVETLRHCATALANLSLYGGPENQQAMIKHKVPVWLFPLAFHDDDNIKYYACLAISSLVANKEIEAAVLKSGTLDLVEPFVTSHSPEEFAKSHVAHVHGQSKNWLQRLVNVLDSKREEARNLAAFHFAMEAGIKKKQGNTQVFHEVGAVEALKKVASSPNAIASKFAAQALLLIGEEVPHKLSQQVPLWTAEDVSQWVKQTGFSAYSSEFYNSRVDGDLLLQLTEDMLKDDIGVKNGILRKRFLRELNQLKRMTDYTSCDSTYLNQVLQSLGPEFCQYTYQMLHCGVQRDTLRFISEEQLLRECGVENSIHRLKIAQAIHGMAQQSETAEEETSMQKPLDVFVSYRRSNGSQLASLLKVHLQLRGFSVFIDVERLEAGKFDYNLLDSIRQAKHFLLVLTPNSLQRCIGDNDCKDWVHKEIVEALQSQCNIIPILDNFQWPEPETLPEDMRAVSYFNGVRWIHDYQDACVDKLERFMRGEMNVRSDGPLGRYVSIGGGAGTPGTPSTTSGIVTAVGKAPQSYQRSASSESAKNGSNVPSDDSELCNASATENNIDVVNFSHQVKESV